MSSNVFIKNAQLYLLFEQVICAYQEIDDIESYKHPFFQNKQMMYFMAYARLILEPGSTRIGRVMAPKEQRKTDS